MDKKQLQEIYLKPDYYWGKKPNELVDKVLEFIPDGQITNKKLIDLGAGEGRDSVFFALQGFNVLAVEIAPIAPDWGKNECLYESQELQSYYKDWELLYSNEYIFDCKSSNIPHQHAVRIIIARKPNNIG